MNWEGRGVRPRPLKDGFRAPLPLWMQWCLLPKAQMLGPPSRLLLPAMLGQTPACLAVATPPGANKITVKQTIVEDCKLYFPGTPFKIVIGFRETIAIFDCFWGNHHHWIFWHSYHWYQYCQWFLDALTIGCNSFQWSDIIGLTIEWFQWIVQVYCSMLSTRDQFENPV